LRAISPYETRIVNSVNTLVSALLRCRVYIGYRFLIS
jgi:hypothetical protein